MLPNNLSADEIKYAYQLTRVQLEVAQVVNKTLIFVILLHIKNNFKVSRLPFTGFLFLVVTS